MRFRKLRLAGFKSFVEPAELLIEPGLTGVVGPNGCGKSNLLEAIRWVMGEGSPKSLRGAGMEDVIFAGTARRPQRSFAEVTLLVEDAAGIETEVTRRIERGAGSAYRLNGRDVRQRDVALLFADAATGAHSPALVSQGRIAAVIAARPTERRQMLEEAAGIAGLHVRRREAEGRLRAAEANLERLDVILADMEARGGVLRRQARAAERYRALSADIRLAEARALHARWREAAAEAERAAKAAERADAGVAAAAETQRIAAGTAERAAAELATARAVSERGRDAAQAAAQALGEARGERDRMTARLTDLARQRDMAARDRAGEDRLALDAADAIARLAEEESAAGAAQAEAQAGRGPAADAVARAEQAAQAAELGLAQALSAEAAEQAELRVAQAAMAAARTRLARAVAEADRVSAERAALADVAALQTAQAAAAERRGGAETQVATATTALAEAERARDAAAADRDAAEAAAASARATLAALESEAAALRKASATQAGRGVPVQAAPGYERALAAALDGDLDAPVADAGLRRWAGAEPHAGDPPLPAGIAALADHVSVPPALARRIAQIGVVATDDGQPLAVGQRLVTQSGRMRRWDGFVAEQAGAAAAERMVRTNRLAELERLLPDARTAQAEAAERLSAATASAAATRAAIEAARRAQAAGEQALRTAMREEDAAAAAIDRASRALAALDDRSARTHAERAEAAREEAAAAEMLARLPDGQATRATVDRLRGEAAGARTTLATARAAIEGVERAVAEATRRLATARSEAKGWRARAGDAARRIAEMAARLAAAEEELARLADRPAALDAQVATLADAATRDAATAEQARTAERTAETAAREALTDQSAATEALATVREARAAAAARAEGAGAARTELSRVAGERFACPAAVLPERIGFPADDAGSAADEAGRHERLVAERDRMGPVNLLAERELAEMEGERDRGQAERDELGQAVAALRGSIGTLNREGRQRLLTAFEAVDGHFRRLFATLFAGGEAHLQLIDADDPLEAGLEIMAQPPGKRLGSLTLLSGGEQALTAVALIFALFLTNPAPICVLDEVDAPLDDANIERFCDLLQRMTQETDTRYLIVTHNAVTMARMHRLFGVTMVERGVSQLVSVDLELAERLVA